MSNTMNICHADESSSSVVNDYDYGCQAMNIETNSTSGCLIEKRTTNDASSSTFCFSLTFYDGTATIKSVLHELRKLAMQAQVPVSSIEALCLCFHLEYTRVVTQEEMTRLLQAIIGFFPNLERLFLEGSLMPVWQHTMVEEGADGEEEEEEEEPLRGTEIFIHTLTAALQPKANPSSLTHLHLDSLEINGTASDFFHLAHTVQSMQSLESVDMAFSAFVQVPVPDETRIYLLDPLVQALTTLPLLQKVALYGYEPLGCLHNATLIRLCQMSTLERLHLISFQLDDDHLALIGTVLGTSCHNSKEEEESNLIELHLDCRLNGQEGCPALANMFRNNKRLKEFSLFCGSLESDNLYTMFDGLGDSVTLERLQLFLKTPFDEASRQSLRAALSKNTSLITVDLHIPTSEKELLDEDVSFHTCLNAIGRGRLFSPDEDAPPSTATWWDLLMRSKEYPRLSYYFLSLNPAALCCLPATNSAAFVENDANTCNHDSNKSVKEECHAAYYFSHQTCKRRRLIDAAEGYAIQYD